MAVDPSLKEALIHMLQSGAAGNTRDFAAWIQFSNRIQTSLENVQNALEELQNESIAVNHAGIKGEYHGTDWSKCLQTTEYQVSGLLSGSPIQLVRSRLEAYLQLQKVPEEVIMDISIATTEAMENAVKYNDTKPIDVRYQLKEEGFEIEIVNGLAEIKLEKDIEAGKYDGSLTLMRGMMVMQRLFDEVDIEIVETDNKAVFKALKQV